MEAARVAAAAFAGLRSLRETVQPEAEPSPRSKLLMGGVTIPSVPKPAAARASQQANEAIHGYEVGGAGGIERERRAEGVPACQLGIQAARSNVDEVGDLGSGGGDSQPDGENATRLIRTS